MPKSRNQKLKLLHLKRILEYYTDEDHGITTQEIRTHLKQQQIEVERKTVYEDIHALEDFGMEIAHEEYGKTYRLIDRLFSLSEIKLMIDSIQASKFLNEKSTTKLIDKLKSFYLLQIFLLQQIQYLQPFLMEY